MENNFENFSNVNLNEEKEKQIKNFITSTENKNHPHSENFFNLFRPLIFRLSENSSTEEKYCYALLSMLLYRHNSALFYSTVVGKPEQLIEEFKNRNDLDVIADLILDPMLNNSNIITEKQAEIFLALVPYLIKMKDPDNVGMEKTIKILKILHDRGQFHSDLQLLSNHLSKTDYTKGSRKHWRTVIALVAINTKDLFSDENLPKDPWIAIQILPFLYRITLKTTTTNLFKHILDLLKQKKYCQNWSLWSLLISTEKLPKKLFNKTLTEFFKIMADEDGVFKNDFLNTDPKISIPAMEAFSLFIPYFRYKKEKEKANLELLETIYNRLCKQLNYDNESINTAAAKALLALFSNENIRDDWKKILLKAFIKNEHTTFTSLEFLATHITNKTELVEKLFALLQSKKNNLRENAAKLLVKLSIKEKNEQFEKLIIETAQQFLKYGTTNKLPFGPQQIMLLSCIPNLSEKFFSLMFNGTIGAIKEDSIVNSEMLEAWLTLISHKNFPTNLAKPLFEKLYQQLQSEKQERYFGIIKIIVALAPQLSLDNLIDTWEFFSKYRIALNALKTIDPISICSRTIEFLNNENNFIEKEEIIFDNYFSEDNEIDKLSEENQDIEHIKIEDNIKNGKIIFSTNMANYHTEKFFKTVLHQILKNIGNLVTKRDQLGLALSFQLLPVYNFYLFFKIFVNQDNVSLIINTLQQNENHKFIPTVILDPMLNNSDTITTEQIEIFCLLVPTIIMNFSDNTMEKVYKILKNLSDLYNENKNNNSELFKHLSKHLGFLFYILQTELNKTTDYFGGKIVRKLVEKTKITLETIDNLFTPVDEKTKDVNLIFYRILTALINLKLDDQKINFPEDPPVITDLAGIKISAHYSDLSNSFKSLIDKVLSNFGSEYYSLNDDVPKAIHNYKIYRKEWILLASTENLPSALQKNMSRILFLLVSSENFLLDLTSEDSKICSKALVALLAFFPHLKLLKKDDSYEGKFETLQNIYLILCKKLYDENENIRGITAKVFELMLKQNKEFLNDFIDLIDENETVEGFKILGTLMSKEDYAKTLISKLYSTHVPMYGQRTGANAAEALTELYFDPKLSKESKKNIELAIKKFVQCAHKHKICEQEVIFILCYSDLNADYLDNFAQTNVKHIIENISLRTLNITLALANHQNLSSNTASILFESLIKQLSKKNCEYPMTITKIIVALSSKLSQEQIEEALGILIPLSFTHSLYKTLQPKYGTFFIGNQVVNYLNQQKNITNVKLGYEEENEVSIDKNKGICNIQ